MIRNKFLPYVRRANGREKAESMRIAFRLAYYQTLRKPYVVMVQKGFPDIAIEVASSKRELKDKPLVVAMKTMSFREWAKRIQRRALRP